MTPPPKWAKTISGASGLSKDEVDRMVKDAQANAADDTKRREAAEAFYRQQADEAAAAKATAEAGPAPGGQQDEVKDGEVVEA